MTRPNRIPAYQHFKARDLAKVRLDGKDHYLGKYGSPESREAYNRTIAEWLRSRADPTPAPVAESPTVTGMILSYWRHAIAYYAGLDGKPSGETRNLRDALRPVRELYGTTLAADFGPRELKAVRDTIVRSGVSRKTVNARVHRIRRAFRWAASESIIPAAVVAGLDTVEPLRKGRTDAPDLPPVEAVPLAIVEATLPYLSAPVAAMVRLQLLTGMRAGEVMAMRGTDLTIADDVWEYRPPNHKGTWLDKGRVIVLGPKAVEVARAFLKPDLSAYLFDPREAVAAQHAARTKARKSKPTPSELRKRAKLPGVARSPRYDRRTYRQAIIRACDKAFPHPTIHAIKARGRSVEDRAALKAWRITNRWNPLQLRHTAATAIRARYGLEAAQVILGHARADVTQVYADRDLGKARSIMGEIG